MTRSRISRRAVLAAALPAVSTSSGCLNRIRTTAGRDRPNQVQLQILTPPRDDDLYALSIANHLRNTLTDAGIDIEVSPIRRDAFLRDVLVNQDFDLYVWRHPGIEDVDELRTLLHTRYIEERGWQNPFGFSNGSIDELLDRQHRGSTARSEATPDLLRQINQEIPFIPIAFERMYQLVRSDVVRPSNHQIRRGEWIFAMRASNLIDPEPFDVRFGVTDARVTKNFNPLSVEYREHHHLPSVVYDPLIRQWNGEFTHWLAIDSEWLSPKGASSPTIECQIRSDVEWHDGEPLTADDVAFTYRLYQDTTLEDGDPVVPTSTFRRETSHLGSVESIDDSTVRFQFDNTGRSTATMALTVPILPEHIWRDRTELTDVAGIIVAQDTTEALVAENLDPIGSGPYAVTEIQTDNRIVLERVPDHFANGDPQDTIGPIPAPTVNTLTIEVRPSVGALVDSIHGGTLAGSAESVGADPRTSEDVVAVSYTTNRLIHVGFNLRRSPLSNRQFRMAINHCIDFQYLADELFGPDTPLTNVPIRDERYYPAGLRWSSDDIQRFIGEPGSATIDPVAARELFREAGFSYSRDGELLQRE